MPIQLPDERDRAILGIPELEQDTSPLEELAELIENEDGSATLFAPEGQETPQEFGSNIADTMDKWRRNELATELLELIDRDKEARKERDRQYQEGILRTGLGGEAPGGANFEGASRVVHPMLAEACVDFAARAMKELCPASGPVKTKINSKADSKALDRAKRKRDFLNDMFMNKMEEYAPEKEQLLTQVPLGGSQYEKYYFDSKKRRICMEFVPVDDVFLPYAASSFYTSQRVTHKQQVTRQTFEERMGSGFYRDLERALPEGMEPDKSESQAASDKIEGRTESGYNEDGLRVVFEVQVDRALEDDTVAAGELAPYIIHIDEDTKEVLAVYRNWAEGDPTFGKISWWVEDKFIPWRGAYGIGLGHLIGSLAGGATGALRALLDSAHINNNPAAVKLKGGRGPGQNVNLIQAGITDIDSGGSDDIRKVLMAMPFNPPSTVLFQLLDWITNQAKGVVATAEERIADASNQMPVGTAMALIEQGSQVFSSIHARLHDAQRRAIKIVCRLIYNHASDEELQKAQLTRDDFREDSDIEPVSDPRIFSEAQRYAQLQEQLKLATALPQLNWNIKALGRRGLELLRVDNVDEVLPKDPEPITSDPVQENQAALLGARLKAHPEQDHAAHINAHFRLLADPFVVTLYDPEPLATLLSHIKEHFAMQYGTLAQQAGQQALQMVVNNRQPVSPDAMAALASKTALDKAAAEMQQFAGALQALQEQIKSKLPPEPMDPGTAAFKAAMAEVERKTAVDKSNAELKGKDLELKPLLEAMKSEVSSSIATLREQSNAEIAAMREQYSLLKNQQNNEQHSRTELLKNHEDNMTQLRVAMEKNLQDSLKGLQQQFEEKIVAAPAPSDSKLNSVIDVLASMMQAKINELEQNASLETEFIFDEDGEPIGARKKKVS